MIHTNRTVTVGNQESIIDSPIILYRGDREVEVEFTLNSNDITIDVFYFSLAKIKSKLI